MRRQALAECEAGGGEIAEIAIGNTWHSYSKLFETAFAALVCWLLYHALEISEGSWRDVEGNKEVRYIIDSGIASAPEAEISASGILSLFSSSASGE